VIVGGILQAFWLTNLGLNQQALNAGEPVMHVFIEPFWQFFIVIGGSGSTMGLVLLYLRSRSAHLRSIGKLSIVPSMFNINEPVIFGSPVVMNPILFIPFLLAPLVNAVIAWTATKTNLINHARSDWCRLVNRLGLARDRADRRAGGDCHAYLLPVFQDV